MVYPVGVAGMRFYMPYGCWSLGVLEVGERRNGRNRKLRLESLLLASLIPARQRVIVKL